MNQSKKHHYIPEFYLKGFCNSNKKLWIYDIEKAKLKSKEFSPSSHFFEFERNTIQFGEEKTDFLEGLYQHLEDKLKGAILKYQTSKTPVILSAKEIVDLQLFLYVTCWRIPAMDGVMNNLIKTIPINQLGFNLINKKTGQKASDEELKKLAYDSQFIETYRSFYPLLKFFHSNVDEKDGENWVIYNTQETGKHFTCDYPIIIRNVNSDNILKEELIFPLTKNQLLVHSKNPNKPKELPILLRVYIDQFLFLQSQKYVGGPDKEYLSLSAEGLQLLPFSKEELRKLIFNSELFKNN